MPKEINLTLGNIQQGKFQVVETRKVLKPSGEEELSAQKTLLMEGEYSNLTDIWGLIGILGRYEQLAIDDPALLAVLVVNQSDFHSGKYQNLFLDSE